MDTGIDVLAPAKINLRLEILAREESGYHGLETVFCALELADSIAIRRSGAGIELRVEGGIETGDAEDNLVVRAARKFYDELGEPPAIRIELHKRIPAAAGLGGGSSDAAAALMALNRLHDLPFRATQLVQWGSELGSDVPFFLCGSPLALAWSRGERLLALPALPRRPVLVANPGIPLHTAGAFREIAARRGPEYEPRAAVNSLASLGSWDALESAAFNDFEPLACERVPEVNHGLRVLREAGAGLALLAGSGASIFGVFSSDDVVPAARRQLEGAGFTCWQTATRVGIPQPDMID